MYNWDGDRIIRGASLAGQGSRWIYSPEPADRRVDCTWLRNIRIDPRELITQGPNAMIAGAINEILSKNAIPPTDELGSLDRRAMAAWKHVAENIDYRPDGALENWQMPSETLARGHGDCEDTAFLLGSLLSALGVSPFCYRVTFGLVVDSSSGRRLHAWVNYKDESGVWRLLESTCTAGDISTMATYAGTDICFPNADSLACGATGKSGTTLVYRPTIVLNHVHVWTVN
ncbi:MAG: hypothetical protein JST22_17680 [Bacteroidetes bacterium]|nr:hypothetical protein [Bacteroidota bacterium]